MFKKKKKCFHENCEDCPLWTTLTWQEEATGKKKDESLCAIIGIYQQLARLENRLIGTQKASEQSRNNSAKVQAMQEALNNTLLTALTNALNVITGELKQHIDREIEDIKKLIALPEK
uniref:Uncharacterized protein n=1 Tax=viral metagenome TaxID=1070528 RepID=A0A6M3J235_9ZZZZ